MKEDQTSHKRSSLSPAVFQRAGAWASLLMVTLGILLSLSLIAHWADPYEAAANDLRLMIRQDPNLIVNLDAINLTKSALSPFLDVQIAEDVLTATRTADRAAVDAYFAANGFTEEDTQALLEDYTLIALSIKNINWLVSKPEAVETLISGLVKMRDHKTTRLDMLLLGTQSTAAHTQVNAIRQQMIIGSTQLLTISANPPLFSIEQSLSKAPDTDFALRALSSAAKTWRGFPISCQILEGQLSKTANDLVGISSIITTAMKNDQDWGYSLYSPITNFIYRSRLLIIALFLGLFFFSIYVYKRFPYESDEVFPLQDPPLTGPPSTSSLEDKLRPRVNGTNGQAKLQVTRADGGTLPLPIDPNSILRIGTDPGCALTLDLQPGQFVEIWIRRAENGDNLEVIQSSVPVYLNGRILRSSHKLQPRDLIAIGNTRIEYICKI